MHRSFAMLSLVASMTMTGANVPLAKALLAAFPVDALLFWRFALAGLLLALLAPFEAGPRLASLGRRQWGAVLVLALFGSVLFTFFVLEGVRRTSGASAGIITATLPAVVALIGIAGGDRPRRAQLMMIGLAVAGVALIQVQPAGIDQRATLVGNALIACAVLCEATFVVVARGISRIVRPIRLSLAVALTSLMFCLPTGLSAVAAISPAAVGAGNWALFAWYTLTASVLCTILWYRGAGHVEPWAAGLATAAVPVAALAVSVLVLGETITPQQIAGAVLVVVAIAVGAISAGGLGQPNKTR